VKVLFSADWHLGYTHLGTNRQPRLADQVRQLERIAAYCLEHEVDVLAVAGDVFEAQERGAARAAASAMMEALREPLARGMRLIAIAGNHDRDYFFETANVWLAAASPGGSDRIVLRTRPELLTVEAGGERVNFALLPFPTATRYELSHEESGSGGVAHKHMALTLRFCEVMEELRKEAEAQRLPTVLLTHVTVEGTTVGTHRISAADDIIVPRGRFPAFELTVVGHIHKPERIGGDHFYYVGVLDRMDIAEREYPTRVLLADIGPEGVREVRELPLDPTPFARVIASDEEEMEAAARALPRVGETLVTLRLCIAQGTHAAPLLKRAGELFRRLYGNVEYEWTDVQETAPAVAGLNPADVEGTIRAYLEAQEMKEEEREALMALVQELRQKTLAEAEA